MSESTGPQYRWTLLGGLLLALVLLQLHFILGDLRQLREQTKALSLQKQLHQVLNNRLLQLSNPELQLPSAAELQQEYNAVLANLRRTEGKKGTSVQLEQVADRQQLLKGESQKRTLQAVADLLAETNREIEREELPKISGSLEGRILALGFVCLVPFLVYLAVFLLRLFKVDPKTVSSLTRVPEREQLFSAVPLSFTQMAMDTLKTGGRAKTSARGYTERVLQSLSNLLVLAAPDSSIQMVNEAVCTTLGYQREELLGQPFSIIMAPDSEPTQPGTHNVEALFQSKQGRSIPVLVSCSAVQAPSGEVDGLVIVGQDITDLKKAERSVLRSRERLRSLMERLVSAQEDERQKVARDLHDGMLQLVIAAELQLSAFRRKMKKKTEAKELEKLVDGIDRLGEAVKEGRRLINNLRPPTLDKFGLIQSLKQEVTKLARELDCQFEFQSTVEDIEVPRAIETTAFRVCQEALSNIRKYAHPKHVSVFVNVTHAQMMITVEDDGVGFDPEEVEKGVGLESMRERTELQRGRFEVESAPDGGTKITSLLPLETGDMSKMGI